VHGTHTLVHGGLRQPGLAVQVRASSVMLSPVARRQEYSRSSLWPLVELCGALVRLSATRYFAKLGIMDGAAVRLTHRIVPRASRRNGGKRHVIAEVLGTERLSVTKPARTARAPA
jgi:hypothetical protein